MVSEAILLPHCLLDFLTPQSELVHWEDTFHFSALHWVMAPRVESASMRDAVHQLHKSLAEPKEMLRYLEAFMFFFFFFRDQSSPDHIRGYLKKMGRNWPWEALKCGGGGGCLRRNNLPLVQQS